MKATRIFRQWQRAGERLGRQLLALAAACANGGTPRQIHDLRVTLRRFRFWARVGKPLLRAPLRKRLAGWAHKVAGLTSRVRDIDASAEWLRSRRADSGTLERFKQARVMEWRQQQRRFRPPSPKLIEGLVQIEVTRGNARLLRRRIRKLEEGFEDELGELLPRFFKLDSPEQHEVRRVVRRWRYLREMLGDRKARGERALLDHLLAVQAAVGDHQNIQLGLQLLAETLPAGAARVRLARRGQQAAIRQRRLIREAIRGLQKELD